MVHTHIVQVSGKGLRGFDVDDDASFIAIKY